jgi:hypothetical protein
METKKRLIVVLGMHRSGTSAITRGLETLGVNLGSDLLVPTVDNPKGYFEDRETYLLNEEILTALNHAWSDLDPAEPEYIIQNKILDEFFDRAVNLLLDRLRVNDLFGIKDPRFCILLPFWNKVFDRVGVPVSYIVSFRNPISVVKSLQSRECQLFCTSGIAFWLWAI